MCSLQERSTFVWPQMSGTLADRSRSSVSDGEHHEVITAHGGSERSGERRSAEWGRVGGSTSRRRHRGRAQLRRERKTGTGVWRGDGVGSLKGRRQETYDVIEIGLIVDAGDPGLIGWARMRERDRSDYQKHQQHSAQASGTRSVQAIENGHSQPRQKPISLGRCDTMEVGEVGCQDESHSLMVWIHLMVRRMRRPLQLLLRQKRRLLVHQSYELPRRVLTVGASLDRRRLNTRLPEPSGVDFRDLSSPPGAALLCGRNRGARARGVRCPSETRADGPHSQYHGHAVSKLGEQLDRFHLTHRRCGALTSGLHGDDAVWMSCCTCGPRS